MTTSQVTYDVGGRGNAWTREMASEALAAAVERAGGRRPTTGCLAQWGAPSPPTLRRLFGSIDAAFVAAVGTCDMPLVSAGPPRPEPETGRPLPY